MDQQADFQFYDIGDNTALVCVDHQQYQKVVVPQLIDMNLQSASRLFEEDVLLKLKTYNYDVVVIYRKLQRLDLKDDSDFARNDPGTDVQRREHSWYGSAMLCHE